MIVSRELTLALSRKFASAIGAALLILQPVLFYWNVLINPSAHIPYDIEGFHLPLIAYAAQCIRNGIAPLWDPYSYCGMPIHADLQAQVFYPFTWLAIFLGNHSQDRDLYYWVEALIPLHMVLAGLFAFLLLRRMGLCPPAALLGASVYQLGGFFASQAQHLCAICTGAWLPLAVLAVFELRRGFRLRWVSVLAIAVSLSVLSGFAATAIIVAVAVLLVAVSLLVTREAEWRMLPPVAAGFLLGAAIAAVELVPLWTLTRLSLASERAHWYLFGGGLPLEVLASLVSPDYYHIFEFPSLYKLPYNFTFLYAYCGIATVTLIALAPLVRDRRNRFRVAAFLILTVLAAFWMLGEHTPVYRFIYTHLPELLRGALYAEYALMAFCFFAGITAAIVLDRFGTRLPRAVVWAIALFTSYDLMHTGAGRPMNSYRGSYKSPEVGYWESSAELAAKLHSLLNRSIPPSRVDYTDASYSQGIYGAGMLGIPTPDGNSPFMLLRLMHLRRLFAKGQPWEREFAVDHFDSPLLNMLNVSVLAGAVPIPPDDVKKAGLEPLEPVRGIQIYRNPHALPRFFLAPRIRRSSSETDTLRMLSQDSFHPAEEAIVEGIPQNREGLATADVTVNQYAANRIQLTVAVNRPAFLVTSEVMYPGWEATVNGAPQPLLMTNGAFCGLALQAGTSRIAMDYRPRSLAFALLLSLVAFFATVTAGLAGLSGAVRLRTLTGPVAEIWGELQPELRKLRGRLSAAIVSRRAAIGSLSLILLAVCLYYWKIVLTSQFSLLTDVETVNRSYAWLQFWVFNIRHGALPLWDSYTFGGHAFCGQMAAAAFYPLHLLLALAPRGRDGLFSPHLYHFWFVFVHFLGACFMFALVREFGLGRFPSFLAGICFSLGGFVGRTSALDLLESGIWLPIVFLFLLRAIRAEDLPAAVGSATMSGLALGMSILAGGADIVLMQAIVLVSAAVFGSKPRSRAALVIGVAIAMVIAAGAVQLLPAIAYGQFAAQLPAAQLSPHSLIAMLMPEAFHGTMGQGEVANPYIGVFPLFLAIIGIWKNWRNSWVRYLTGLALAAFLCSLGSLSLLHGLFSTLLSGLWVEQAARFVYLADFSLCALAAFGAATLLSGEFHEGIWSNLNRILLGVMTVSGAALLFAAGSGQEITSAVSLPVTLIFLSYGLFWHIMHNRSGPWFRILLVALVLFDLNAFDPLPRSRNRSAKTGTNQLDRLLSARAAAQFLKWQPDPSRVEIAASPPLNIGDAFGIASIESNAKPSADLLNVRYLLMPASAPEPGPVYQNAFWKIYENPGAYPRAWIVHQAVFEPSPEKQLERLNTPGFDPRQSAVLDGRVSLEPTPQGAHDGITVLKTDGNQVELEADARSAGLLVLSERYSPGWGAKVNGIRAPVYRANGGLRAIPVPRGDNLVVLDFNPWSVYLGGVLTLAAFIGPLVLEWHRRRAQRDSLRGIP